MVPVRAYPVPLVWLENPAQVDAKATPEELEPLGRPGPREMPERTDTADFLVTLAIVLGQDPHQQEPLVTEETRESLEETIIKSTRSTRATTPPAKESPENQDQLEGLDTEDATEGQEVLADQEQWEHQVRVEAKDQAEQQEPPVQEANEGTTDMVEEREKQEQLDPTAELEERERQAHPDATELVEHQGIPMEQLLVGLEP